ncbi:MAG: helix-turn-helix domain-containing protein [Oscillospiraceae bacterium]|jgi:excisionase family DNA binding protein|nr:helix-turn-helix domain-containing protein [Oscillospiraceae bacterium]
MFMQYPDVLTISELREILYIGRNKAYALLMSGELRGFKVGRAWRVAKSEVERWVRERGR